jgi:hypothetical protein
MNVATIEMPVDEAREKLREYRLGLKGREPTNEDRGIVTGLKAIAAGRKLIDILQVFRNCPADRLGRPALAIARAHWRNVWLRRFHNGSAQFGESANAIAGWGRPARHRFFKLPDGTIQETQRKGSGDLKAIVPLIPPNLRPATAIESYCILFEAEWEPVPPIDPMLIRHLHGSLYAVLAHWDLTPLERAVLAGRLSERR